MPQVQLQYHSSGLNLYAFVRHPTGTIWSTGVSTFISYTAGQRIACVQPLREDGTDSAYYMLDLPTSIPANIYMISIFNRLSATPANSDPKIFFDSIQVNSTGLISLHNLPVNAVQVTGSPIVANPTVNANIIQVSGQPVNLEAIQTIPSGQFPYFCEIRLDRDTTNTIDEYTGTWFKNAIMVTSGEIVSPTIQVIRRSNGQNLIGVAGASGMAHIDNNLGIVKYDERTNLVIVGEPYIVKMTAVIDGLTRTWPKIIGRDG